MSQKFIVNIMVPSEGGLSRYFPNNQLDPSRILPEPYGLPEVWEDELVANLLNAAQRNYFSAKTQSFKDADTGEIYVIPSEVSLTEFLGYIAETYPKLLKRCQKIAAITDKHRGICDLQGWRLKHWGGPLPVTLKAKTVQDKFQNSYYQLTMETDSEIPGNVFSLIAEELSTNLWISEVNEDGSSRLYEACIFNSRMLPKKSTRKRSDTGFSAEDFELNV